MTNKKKSILSIVTVLIILLLGTSIGISDISLIDTLSIILNKTLNISLAGNIPAKDISIIWKLRLPRVLLAFLVGGCLATGGSVVQSVLKNELASPYTLGVSSGASLGAGLIIVTGITIPVVGSFTLPFVGFVFGLMTVFSVILFSTKIDKAMSNNTIILIGMVLSLFENALLTTLTSFFSNDLKKIALWQMGSFAMRGWTYVNLILPFFLIGMIGVLRFTKEMDILTFGEEQAKAVGVDTYKVKRKLFILCAILTGGSVALSGTIGFVGLIIPHCMRLLVGSDHRLLLPFSYFGGAAFMIICDTIARTIAAPTEIPVGVITAVFGAPYFIYLLYRNSKNGKF